MTRLSARVSQGFLHTSGLTLARRRRSGLFGENAEFFTAKRLSQGHGQAFGHRESSRRSLLNNGQHLASIKDLSTCGYFASLFDIHPGHGVWFAHFWVKVMRHLEPRIILLDETKAAVASHVVVALGAKSEVQRVASISAPST